MSTAKCTRCTLHQRTSSMNDNNFLSYQPALRQRTEELTPVTPYQKIQSLSTTPTKPEFANPRPTYSDVVREKLKPRSEWMKCQPAEMSDSEADNAWHLGNERLFGTRPTTTSAIEHEIATLRSQLARQRQLDTMLSSSEPCPQLPPNVPSSAAEQDYTT